MKGEAISIIGRFCQKSSWTLRESASL